MDHLEWYRLDNAAKAYPPLVSSRITTLFRLEAHLRHPVKAAPLQEALDHTLKRLPLFQVEMGAGFFWFFLSRNRNRAVVEADSRYPCMGYSIRKAGHFPFRVRAFQNKIILEVSHSLTDGTGALAFMKCLVTEYIGLGGKGRSPSADESPPAAYPLCGEEPHPDEWEDSFKTHYKKRIPAPPKPPKAYHIPGPLLPKKTYRITTGKLPVSAVSRKAKDHKATITEYLLAQFMAALQDIQEEDNKGSRKAKPIRVSLPVNLRPLFHSRTLRNFFLHVEPTLDTRLGHYSLEEIISKVHHSLRLMIDPKFIQQQITRNVKGEQNVFVRLLPLFMKATIIRKLYRYLGESRLTSGFSNLGRVSLPAEVETELTGWRFIPPPSPLTGTKCSLITFQDTLAISFGSQKREKRLEYYFFTRLRKEGIPVYIETNERS